MTYVHSLHKVDESFGALCRHENPFGDMVEFRSSCVGIWHVKSMINIPWL